VVATNGRNFADVWEAVARRLPDAPAQMQGDRVVSWAEFDRRANGIATALTSAPASAEQDKVAQYLYNCPEYLESVFAAFKAGMAVVNTNYRYTADELLYLWNNADVTTVIFHAAFAPTCDVVRRRLPRITTWLWVDDGSGPCPDWAISYSALAEAGPVEAAGGPWGRSGDHLLLLYTGGTTGMPKGVMWRQDDLFGALDTSNRNRMPPGHDPDATGDRVTFPGPRNMPAAPLMHGTGLFNTMANLMLGGSITTLRSRHFDPVEYLDTVEARRIRSSSIVGDAFAAPILRALDSEPDRWDISSLELIVSSGVMWTKDVKDGLLRHQPGLTLVDALGSSEAIGMAANTTTSTSSADTARFQLGPNTRILTDDDRDVDPGSGEIGRVAFRGRTPIGYYKDDAKTAETFVTIGDERYSIPGDLATVEADGAVTLLGRGSQCINTGGEKVFPEEVEEVLKLHPLVADAAVIGVPDERWGERVTALIEPVAGTSVDADDIVSHVRRTLAAYKAPKRILEVETIGRAPNGKLDYRRLRSQAIATEA